MKKSLIAIFITLNLVLLLCGCKPTVDNSAAITEETSPATYVVESEPKETETLSIIESSNSAISSEKTQDIELSDSQIIEYFVDLLNKSKEAVPKEIKAGRLYLCTQQEKMDNWNPENPVIQSYIEVNVSNEQMSRMLNEFELSYSAAPFTVAEDREILNAEFNIQAIYEAYELKITASDSALYIRTYIDGNNYRIKVEDKAVFSTFIKIMDSNTKVFDFNDITDTEYITLYYVKDADLKDFPNNKRLSEMKITDNDTVNKIVEAVMQNSVPTMTYPSREGADLVFHTSDGDIYFKIKNPIIHDENNLQLYEAEPTIIAEGYFWYSCPKVYGILMDYFKEIG